MKRDGILDQFVPHQLVGNLQYICITNWFVVVTFLFIFIFHTVHSPSLYARKLAPLVAILLWQVEPAVWRATTRPLLAPKLLNRFSKLKRESIRDVGRGHWAMAPLERRRRPLRLFSALQSRMFYRENVVGRRPQAPSNDEKSLRKVPPGAFPA